MKRFYTVTIALLIFYTLFPTIIAEAHPGRTDANGGHTCRTNCEKWGLEYGEYHYHNTNKSTSNSSSSSSTPAPNTPSKPAYTQQDVDDGNAAGKQNGYDAGYARNSKNPATDSSNEGYKKGYASGYDAGYAQGLKDRQEQDRQDGQAKGEEDGKQDYQTIGEKDIKQHSSASIEFQTAYTEAYNKAYDREKALYEAEIQGYDLGYSLAALTIPQDFSDDKTLAEIFRTNYQSGYDVRETEENEKSLATGLEHGYDLVANDSANIDPKFTVSYEKGYDEGKLTRKKETIDAGYQSAYVELDYKEPEHLKDNEELISWFKEGYDSNTAAVKIKESAFENGYTNSDYFIPEEFKENEHSIALYDDLFENGQQLRKDEQSKRNVTAASIIFPLGGIAIGGGYMYQRRKKKHTQ